MCVCVCNLYNVLDNNWTCNICNVIIYHESRNQMVGKDFRHPAHKFLCPTMRAPRRRADSEVLEFLRLRLRFQFLHDFPVGHSDARVLYLGKTHLNENFCFVLEIEPAREIEGERHIVRHDGVCHTHLIQ